jgi:hypothetical protein
VPDDVEVIGSVPRRPCALSARSISIQGYDRVAEALSVLRRT